MRGTSDQQIESLVALTPECWQSAKVGHLETREIRDLIEV